MKLALTILTAALLTTATGLAEKPHILYINADDLGVMDVGYNGGGFHTPHLDRIAQEGMIFSQAYAPAANCAPSRACVHSGKWGSRHGVFTVGSSERGDGKTRKLVPVANTQHLAPSIVTMAEALKMGGYKTIHLGKYHIGKDPLEEGFDVNVGGDSTGSPASGYYPPWKNGSMKSWSEKVEADTHRIEIYVKEALRFMESHREEPMFIHFSPYLVHTPLTKVPEYVDLYDDSPISPVYGSMVTKFDEAVGHLLDALDKWELTENTLIVFSSDNGGIAAVHSQKPHRAGKGSYYEGGVREPMVMRWPAVIQAGSTCDELVNTLDLYPTFLAAAALPVPDGVELDGVSLVPLMRQEGEWNEIPQFWHFPVYLQAYNGKLDDARDPLFRTRPGSAVRSGDWKLHEYFEDSAVELYNLAEDPG